MTSNRVGNRIISPLSKVICYTVVIFFSTNALADYYVVYPTMQAVQPSPCVVYHKPKPKLISCATKPHKKTHKHHKYAKVYKKKSTAVVTVSYVYNNNCGPCDMGYGSYNSSRMIVDCGCGTTVYSGGSAVRHSDSYYMRGCDDDGYCDPNMDGNTLDNDIYY